MSECDIYYAVWREHQQGREDSVTRRLSQEDIDLFDKALRKSMTVVHEGEEDSLSGAFQSYYDEGFRDGLEAAAQLVETHTEDHHRGEIAPKRGPAIKSVTGYLYAKAIRALAPHSERGGGTPKPLTSKDI